MLFYISGYPYKDTYFILINIIAENTNIIRPDQPGG